jgi:putative phosphoesterase
VHRLALLADIHGNLPALEAALDDLGRRSVGEIACLGDLAAGGPNPREVLATLRAAGCRAVRGNADEWLLDGLPEEPQDEDRDRLSRIVSWARDALAADEVAYLSELPATRSVDLGETSALCFHASPRSTVERLLATTPDETLEPLLEGVEAAVLAGGHTHLQLVRRVSDRLLVNPGSVGLPLGSEGRWAEYAVVEADAGVVSLELRRVAVDPAAVARAATRAGMPHGDEWGSLLARRIGCGNARARAVT